jgi:putative ABC transport system permease protein
MRWIYKIPLRLRSLFRRSCVEEELTDELRFHLQKLMEEKVAQGVTPEEARYAALRELGGVEQIKEECRDMWKVSLIEDFLQDMRYGFRQLRRGPGFTAVAALALGLGIGANTAVFSVINGVLLRPLPYPEPDRLVWLWPASLRTGQVFGGAISAPDFLDYRARSAAFEHLAAFMRIDSALTGSGEPERVPLALVSAGFFETLGIKPVLGRTISPDDEEVQWPQVVVLSYGLWQARFGGDPNIVGKTINLDGKGMTIVGVMPAGFQFPKEALLWNPLPFKFAEMQVRRFHFIRAIGRLKPGVSIGQAQAEMTSLCLTLEKLYPDSNTSYGVKPVLLKERLVGDMRPTLTLLMTSVGFVLLIACANVAHLLLARATARQKEIAVRSSLGASGGRLMRQLLTESVLLGLLGGAFGVLLAVGGLRALIAMNVVNIPRLDQVHLDLRALAFTAALSILTGIVFGLAPARRASKLEVTETLKEGGRSGSPGCSHQRLHHALVAAEVAISLVLLIGAGVLIHSFARLQNVDPGFNPTGVISVQVSWPATSRSDLPKGAVFFSQLLKRLQALPGVQYAGLISELPLSGQDNDTYFTIEGRPPVEPSNRPDEDQRLVSSDYFKAMGIPLIQGRYFSESDNESAPKVVIVNRSFASKYFSNQNPLGQHLTIDRGEPFRCQIVGVVGDVRHHALASRPSPAMYVPYAQSPSDHTNVVIRSRTPRLALLAEVKYAVQALNKDIPVYGIHSMDELVSGSVAEPRFRTLLLGTFAAIALILAAAGIYGVMSYSVTQRTHEIGVRVALGAERRDVMRLVLGQELVWVLAGITVGLAVALALAGLITSLLYQVRPIDPLSFVGIPIILAAVALLASYIPARRALKVDPTVALRYE